MKTHNCSFRADQHLVDDLDALSRELGCSRAEAIRTAVNIGIQAVNAAKRDTHGAAFEGQTKTRLLIQLLGGMLTNERQMDLLEQLVESEGS